MERNAIIGDNAEARKADIPIVQLNPGGTLNYKYMGEAAVRGAGVPYTVIRSTGARAQTVRITCKLSGNSAKMCSVMLLWVRCCLVTWCLSLMMCGLARTLSLWCTKRAGCAQWFVQHQGQDFCSCGMGCMVITACPHATRVGLTSEDADVPFLLEASQGDRISGKIARAEVASLVAAALASPAAAGAQPLFGVLIDWYTQECFASAWTY